MVILYILLAILALLVVLLLVPVRYSVTGTIGSNTDIFVKVSWLLRFIFVQYTYKDRASSLDIRIAGFNPKKRKNSTTQGKAATSHDASVESSTRNTKSTSKTSEPEAITHANEIKTKPNADKKHIKHKKKSASPKPKRQIDVKAVLTHPDLKIIMGLIFNYLKKTAKALKPKIIRIKAVVGLNDPYTTGLLLGAYETAAGILRFRRNIQIKGDFDKYAFNMDLTVAGRISAGSVLGPLVWLCTRKPVINVIKKYISSGKRRDDSDGKR